MKKLLLSCLCIFNAFTSFGIENMYGSGTINIATNECIVLTARAGFIRLFIDGNQYAGDGNYHTDPLYIAGPHIFSFHRNIGVYDNDWDTFISFRRLTNMCINTLVTKSGETNIIDVPLEKTIQFVSVVGVGLGGGGANFFIQPLNSTNWYAWSYRVSPCASFAGPVKVMIPSVSCALSYYFVEDVVPSVMQINVEKSYDLTNWDTTATYFPKAEPKAFFRLKITQ